MKYLIIFVVATSLIACKEIFYPIRKKYLEIYSHRKGFISACIYYGTTLGMSMIFSPVFFYICVFNKSRCERMRQAVIEDLIKFEER